MSDQWLQLGFSVFLSMQKHAMLIFKKANDFINSGQVPVIAGDCPLCDRPKKCQWKFPDEVGESKMVCLMGFLHVKMASQQGRGELWLDLAGSGCSPWQQSSPRMLRNLSDSDVKRTRHLYQLTLAWLHVLRVQAYSEYCHQVK